MNATAAADAAGGAGDESRFPESVLITWVPDDWTLTPGAVFAVAESAKFPFLNDGGERQPFGGLHIRIVALQCTDGPVVHMMRRLYDEFHASDAAARLALEGLTLEILAISERDGAVVSGKPPRWLLRVRETLDDEFQGHVSLASLARIAGVHPAHLSRSFRSHFGCTLSDYLRRLRLEQAKCDLATSSIPLKDIALSAGYADQSHFSTAFRRHTGLSPGEFRRLTGR